MTFAKWVFTLGGLFGLLMITPLFFLEDRMAALGSQGGAGGPLTHPENYYGFLSVTFAWQLVYLVIGRNPAPYRPIMLLGALGKVMFAALCWWLVGQGRLDAQVALLSSTDLVLAALFVAAWWKTRSA